MSALGLELPQRAPAAAPRQPRRLDVVPNREQRGARPKSFYALVTVGGLFAILVAQLLLSIVVSNGAYQISALQQEQRELARDQQLLTEELHVLESPQHLAANAEQLGMVTNSNTAYLRLSDGTVLGDPASAVASDAIRWGADGGPLVQNELLAGVSLASATTPAAQQAAAAEAAEAQGAPAAPAVQSPVASTDAVLPSPTTR